jgi:formamidopyrimidine-DNA glycosylase
MPELPEVETIANGLRQGGFGSPSILNQRIVEASLLWERTLAVPSPKEFTARVVGQTITAVSRRGKFLLLTLTPDSLIIHLRMSGDLIVEPADAPIPAHHRLVLKLQNGLRLGFNDTRKFGRAWLVADPAQVVSGLGPEPFAEDLTPAVFHASLLRCRRQLKPLLLDQSFLAGLGNIYTDEALFLARLHPLTSSQDLSYPQAEVLLASIRQVLQEGIRHHGASIDWVYRGGDFQNYFRVYQRTGQPCLVCSASLQRIVVGQRGTHFCPNCQTQPQKA